MSHRESDFFFYPLYYPFRDYEWKTKLWWVPIILFIPIFNLIILSGWKMSIMKRLIDGHSDPLPYPEDIPQFFKDGILLFLAKVFYVIIPLLVLFLFKSGIMSMSILLFDFSKGVFVGDGPTLRETAGLLVEKFVLWILVTVFWYVAGSAIYTAGKIRYSATEKVSDLFNLFSNFIFIGRNISGYIKSWLFSLFLAVLLCSIEFVLGRYPYVNILSLVICVLVYIWSTGYEYGSIGKKAYENGLI